MSRRGSVLESDPKSNAPRSWKYPHAVAADVPKIIAMARTRYPGIDVSGSARWLSSILSNQDYCVLYSPICCAIATVVTTFYYPTRKTGHLLMLFGDADYLKNRPWIPFRMLQQVIDWSRSRGATTFRFGADTGIDFGAYAKRLRATADTPAYIVDLE